MTGQARHDTWQSGKSYDAYMGRWSRQIAPRFIELLDHPEGLDWFELGCGTGVLTKAIVEHCNPARIYALDPSEGFIAAARQNVPDKHVSFHVGGAADLTTLASGSHDVAVAGLVLNFLPDKVAALRELKRIVRPGGTVAFYVWDYPGGGVEFMRAFWTAAVALDPAACDLTEDRRFPFCSHDGLLALAREADLDEPKIASVTATSVFQDFGDYWQPFTLGAGPAPGYCASLSGEAREQLRKGLSRSLPYRPDGSITLGLRAWAVLSRVH